MRTLAALLRSLALLVISPLLLLVPVVTIALTDLLAFVLRPKRPPDDRRPRTNAASVVIPNWNGRDLLEKYLPSVVEAMSGAGDNEIIVVDDGSTDGSAGYLRQRFPDVRLEVLPKNLGFGSASNAGFAVAKNDIVVLLNSDMRVEPGFLQPLLDGFTDEKVFAVSCQIFFSDPDKLREETGLTEGWWEDGSIRVRHRIDERVDRLYPCFYGGGGSCAFERRKLLELGGFDSILAPFYLEDADLGYMAWKRGWKVLYQPDSHVYHEHRGTIGKHFSQAQIQTALQRNFLLFSWKNVHEWRRLAGHFAYAYAGGLLSLFFGASPQRTTLMALWRALLRLPAAVGSRWRARGLSIVGDAEALRRPLGGYFRDRFTPLPPAPARLRVLFVSPYPLDPPVHGGAVFMSQTCRELAQITDLHLLVKLELPSQEAQHREIAALCASAEFLNKIPPKPKLLSSLTPHAVREFQSDDLNWIIQRKMFLDEIDVLQLEYLPMGQYGGPYDKLACVLFEHDVYFQSISRALARTTGLYAKLRPFYEYIRALRYETDLLPVFDRVQVCSRDNANYLASYLPALKNRIDPDHRAGIDVSRYRFIEDGREPLTLLFLGSFRHTPNVAALEWLVTEALPLILAEEPSARLVVVGSEPPTRHAYKDPGPSLEFRGFVEDVREPLSRYAVFACPILSGSGVRVKLLEAFSAGIPVVSTTLGAEGLTSEDGHLCALADDPRTFAAKVVGMFRDPDLGLQMARRAREDVEKKRDMAIMTRELVNSYRQVVERKRSV